MNLNEQIFGTNRSEKINEWDKEIFRLNQKYNYWLSQRQDMVFPNDETKIDQLENHYLLRWDDHQTGIRFIDDEMIPKEIIDEILNSFHKIFD